ncbi:hypothetical protein HDU82_003617 [Entophlyctis luteolus]|nr:hypothetical protein HDU82_003617 [Entophlyctis luteolus]
MTPSSPTVTGDDRDSDSNTSFRVTVVANPIHTGARAAVAQLLRRIPPFVRLQVAWTHSSEHAESLGSTAVNDEQPDDDGCLTVHLIIVGGDGTLHDVVNGVFRTSSTHSPRTTVTVGIVPTGSGNALATTLGIDNTDLAIDTIVRCLTAGRRASVVNARRVNVLSVAIATPPYVTPSAPLEPPQPTTPLLREERSGTNNFWPDTQMYALCVVSYGFHAQLVKQSEYLRLLFGNIRFLICAHYDSTLNGFAEVGEGNQQQVQQFRYAETEATSISLKFEGVQSFGYFAGTKVSFFEKGFRISPFADPSAETLDVISFEGAKKRGGLMKFLQGVSNGASHLAAEGTRIVRTHGFVVQPLRSTSRWLGAIQQRKQDNGGQGEVCVDGKIVGIAEGSACWVRGVGGDKLCLRVLVESQ